MITNYQHHIYPKQSEFIKYRGKTGQIDVKDTIIAILAHKPGLTHDELKDMIYHPDFNKSRFYNVSSALSSLISAGTITEEHGSGQYYLLADALTHDISKTKVTLDALMAKGLTPEQITFLSSGIIMSGEQARSEHEGHNYNVNDTVASSPAIVPPVIKVEEPIQEVIDFDGVKMVEVEPGVHEPIEEIAIADPFENMDSDTYSQIKSQAIMELNRDAEAAQHEIDRLEMEADEQRIVIEQEQKEKVLIAIKAKIDNEYKNKLNSIRSAADLLGAEVEIMMPSITGQVVGTILEIKSDGILFLILFSQDQAYLQGSVHMLFYEDGVSYKIAHKS